MKKGFSSVAGLGTILALVLNMVWPMQANADDDPCLSSTAIIGTPGDDLITGTAENDIICSLGGNDTIDSLAGDDIIIAGDGDDRIVSMEGNDYIEAGEGADFVDAGGGNDEILGNPGDDILWGGLGIDELLGLAGSDKLDGGAGADLVDGGVDRDYCVKDSEDEKALSCFYDTKAPILKSISVSANSRSIDTSTSAQWVRVRALVAEGGSGLSEVGFLFEKDFSTSSFGANGSLRYPEQRPTDCDSLDTYAQTPPPNLPNPKSHWCIAQQSSSAVLLEFLIVAPYRLEKGTYKLAGLTLTDGALNQSSQNGRWFNAVVKQTASVPSGIPVLRSIEFISANKINTSESDSKIIVEASISTGPVGLSWAQIKFQRELDRKSGFNSVDLTYDSRKNDARCDLQKYPKSDQNSTCVLSDEGGVVKLLLVANLPKNSPAGTYKLTFLGLSSKTGKTSELSTEELKKDSRYEKFTGLAIVQFGASKPFQPTGSIELLEIKSDATKIDTAKGVAKLNIQITISRSGEAKNWTLFAGVNAMHCPSGVVRKFNNYKSKSKNGVSIQAGEYCSEIRNEGTGNKWWPNFLSSSQVAHAGYTLAPGVNSASSTLSIPASFRKGMIIVGLSAMSVEFGEQRFETISGNWSSLPDAVSKTPFPGTLSCGKYPSCTEHYVVIQNGQ